tara:strand:- start:1079 stop:7294 length:6216 start_codon:yes stop_codon:yes gene_type:complete
MPEYTIQDAETKRTLRVRGPTPPTPADMEALFAAEYQREEAALALPVEEIIPEALVEYPTEVEAPEVEDQSFLRSIADVPLQVGMGAAYGVRAITEAFGADNEVAENIRGIEDYLDSLLSAQSKADSAEVARLQQEAEDKGFAPQVWAALQGIAIAPIDFMANAVGTVIPTAAAALVAGMAAPAVGVAAPVLAGAAALGTGTVMGAGIVKGSVFDAVSEELMKQGISEEEAEKVAQEAQAYGGKNLDQIALGAILGAFASRAGLEPLLAKTLTKEVAENVAKRGVLKSAGISAAQEAGPEALQGAQEQLARNIALGREEMVEAEVPLMRGVVGAGTLEGLAGGLAAGPLGALQASGSTEEVVDSEVVEPPAPVTITEDNGGSRTGQLNLDGSLTVVRRNDKGEETSSQTIEGEAAVSMWETQFATAAASQAEVETEQEKNAAIWDEAMAAPSPIGEETVEPSSSFEGLGLSEEEEVEGARDAARAAATRMEGDEVSTGEIAPEVTAEEEAETVDDFSDLTADELAIDTAATAEIIGPFDSGQIAASIASIKVADPENIVAASQASPEQLLTADLPTLIEKAKLHNAQVAEEVITKMLGPEKAAEYSKLKPRDDNQISWLEAHSTRQFELDREVDKRWANDERLEVFNRYIGKFDETSPQAMGRSIGTLFQNAQDPDFKSTPEYAGIQSALTYAREKGWDLNEVAAGAQQGAVDYAGTDAAELFPIFFGEPPTGTGVIVEGEVVSEVAKLEAPPIAPGAKRSANVGDGTTQPDNAFSNFNVIRQAIDYVKKNTTNKLLRNLANRLAPVMGNTRLVVVTDPDAQIDNPKTRNLFNSSDTQAVYDEVADTIYVNPVTGMNEEVILHESLHKGTAAKVAIYENSDPTNEGLTPKEVLYLDKIKSLMESANKNFAAKESAGNSTEADRNLADAGAFTNLYEFIAYGRTNGAMQQLLNGMPSTEGKTTLFAQFVDLLRQLFNIPASQKNAFMELVTASDSLLVPTTTTGNAGQILANRKISDATQQRIDQLRKDIRNATGGPRQVLANTGELMALTRNGTKSINTLKGSFSRMSDKAVVAIGKVLTTTDITRWIGDVVPVEQINKDIQNFIKARNIEIAKLHTRIQGWAKFTKEFPQEEKWLGETMHESSILQVDLTEYATAEESIANDATQKGLNDRFATAEALATTATANNAPDAAALSAKAAALVQEIEERKADIRSLYAKWDDVGKVDNKKGHEIYQLAKDAYKETFEKYQRLLKEHIESASLNLETQRKLIAMVTRQYQEANQLKVYFPLMRYGKFWISVGKGDNAPFFMRETAEERDVLLAEIIADRNDPNGEIKDSRGETELMQDGELRIGNELKEGYKHLAGTTQELKDLFSLVDEMENSQDTTQLKDGIYQLYLMTQQPGTLRRKFLRRKGTLGYSEDAFRNFITSQASSANQLARFEFNPKLELSIGAAEDSLEGMPRDQGQLKYAALVREIAARARSEINPVIPPGVDLGKLASLGNQLAFVYMLTAPKSALIQLTQVPVVGIPTLIANGYGKRKVLRTLGGYLNVFSHLGKAEEVSVINSKYIENHPDSARLKAGFQMAKDLGILNVTYSADISARKKSPTDRFDRLDKKGWRFFVDSMGFLFHHSERLSREVMFMSALELELGRLKQTSPSLSSEEAVKAAGEKAVKLTYETLFNYTLYEKPPLMKHPVGKIATQFLTYPLQMTSFLIRNFFGTVWPTIPKAERKAAATKLFGTIGMTTLFAGVVGFPGYTFIMGVAEGVREALRPDEDDEDADIWYDENDEGNPLGKRNLDLWFREWWIPTMFGPDSDIASALGLTPETAQGLARGIEMGPISALTDWNIGSSVTLDHLWFQDSVPSDDMKSAFTQFLFDTFGGPLGAMGSQIAGGIQDMNEGNFDRGWEKFAPAFFRGPIKAVRVSQEGTITQGQRAQILDAEFYTMGKILGQGLNFQSTTEAEMQKANFLAKRVVVEVQKERTKVLNQINLAYAKDMENSTSRTQANIDAALDAVYEYNYRNGFYPIDGDTVRQSITGRARTRAEADQGLVVPQKDLSPLASDLVRRSRTN